MRPEKRTDMLPADLFRRELGLPIDLTGGEFELSVAVSPSRKTCKHLILNDPIMSQTLRLQITHLAIALSQFSGGSKYETNKR